MTLTMPWKAKRDTPVNGVAGKLDEVRRALSQEAEHIAQVASDFAHEASVRASDAADLAAHQASHVAQAASSQAQSLTSDGAGSANNIVQQLMKGAAEIGTAVALTSRKTAQDVAENAQSTAKDLRKIRLTTEPKKTGPDFMPGITLLGGFGAGIAIMYFLDPEKGRARRNLLRDKLTSWSRSASDAASGKAKHLGNRAAGAVAETRKQISGPANGTAAIPTEPIDVESDTQTWETSSESFIAPTGFDTTPAPAADPSTTDTWGEQPQASTVSTDYR